MQRLLAGACCLALVFACSCASDNEGTYVSQAPQRLQVVGDADDLASAEYEVMNRLAARETRPDGATSIPSMRQSSETATRIDGDVGTAGVRSVLSFAGADGTLYEIERVTMAEKPVQITLKTTGGPDPDARASEFFAAMTQALGDEGFVEAAPAAK